MKKLFLIPLLALLCTITAWADNQAKIGNTEYATLTAALAAAQDGDEVTVLTDVKWSGGYQRVQKAITLDLNGHTLMSTDDETTAYTTVIAIFPGAGKNVIVKNGTIKSSTSKYTKNNTKSSKYVVWAYTGNITLQDLNVSGADYAVYNNGGANVTMEGNNDMRGELLSFAFTKGSLNINDGVYNNGVAVNTTTGVNVVMNGGTINTAGNGVVLNGTTYSTFTMNGGTINATSNGVNLNKNYSFTMERGTINAKQVGVNIAATNSFTMNGGEINVRGGNNYPYGVRNYGTTTINNGNITAITTVASYIGKAYDDNNNIVDKPYTPFAYAICGDNNSTTIVNGGYLKATKDEEGLYGSAISVWDNASLTMTNGTLEGYTYGLSGNGSHSGTTIAISGGTIKGGVAGIYHPQGGTLNISGNAYIEGASGVQLCSGYASAAATEIVDGAITGGTIVATGADQRATKTGDGIIPDGAAVSVVNRNYPGGTPKFQIVSGVFKSAQGQPLMAYTWKNNTASEWPTEDADGNTVDVRNFLSAIGGYFNGDVSTFLLEDYKSQEVIFDGTTYHMIIKDNVEEQTAFTESSDEEAVRLTADVEVGNGTEAHTETADYVEVAQDKTLTIKDNATLEVGNGGLVLAEENAQLVIEEGGVVTVGTNGIISTNASNIVIESGEANQGVLLIDPNVTLNTTPLATIKLKTNSNMLSSNPWEYTYQRFAIPVRDAVIPTNDFAGTLFEGEEESGYGFESYIFYWTRTAWANCRWTDLKPFTGYQLANNSKDGGVTYTFTGNLIGNNDGSYEFVGHGFDYFGNSYTAPIVIQTLLEGFKAKNPNVEASIWVYDYDTKNWSSVTLDDIKDGFAATTEIKSMDGFLLRLANGSTGTADVSYADAIWNNPNVNPKAAASAPARRQTTAIDHSVIITVAAQGSADKVTLVERADRNASFENGADATKYMNESGLNIYAQTPAGSLSRVATNDLEGTLLTFEAAKAEQYTISFSHVNGNTYALRDNTTGEQIDIVEGTTYTFTQEAGTQTEGRFEIVKRHNVVTAIDHTTISPAAKGIYTVLGQYIGEHSVWNTLPAGLYVVDGVKVVK